MAEKATATQRLSVREDEIAALVATGKSNRAIADALSLSERTVEHHVASIFNKLGVHSRAELVAAVLRGDRRTESSSRLQRPPNNNLPLQLTSFVGREQDVGLLDTLLQQNRLVTLVGTGGAGKTRCAIELGAQLLNGFDEGVWLVQLAPVADASLIASVIAQTLGVQEGPSEPILTTLLRNLEPKRLLLVLDNCEHVTAETAILVAAMLRRCPHLQILATSREPLRIGGERVYRLPSLSAPSLDATPKLTRAIAETYGATALFAERAQAVDHRFALSDDNAMLVAQICRRLDGIPLAIELAAARVRILSLEALSEKLNQRFHILTDGDRTAVPRQQTMRAAIDWSYGLLCPQDQRLFEKLSVFAGGWTLAAATAICADEGAAELDLLERLSSLVDKSLVVAEPVGDAMRFHLLESMRAYSVEHVGEKRDRDRLRHRHAQWILDFSHRSLASSPTTHTELWLATVKPEVDNVRAALAWGTEDSRDLLLCGCVVGNLRGLWDVSEYREEGLRYAVTLCQLIDEKEHPLIVARLWGVRSNRTLAGERVAAAKRRICLTELADGRFDYDLAQGYVNLAYGLRQTGHFSDAEVAANRALEFLRVADLSRSRLCAGAKDEKARNVGRQGRFGEARALFEESLRLFADLSEEAPGTYVRGNMAELEFCAGDIWRALSLCRQALTVAARIGDSLREGMLLTDFAGYHLALGEFETASTIVRAAFASIRRSFASQDNVCDAMQAIGAVVAHQGDVESAALLLGYVETWYSQAAFVRTPLSKLVERLLKEALNAKLSPSAYDEVVARGRRLTDNEAIGVATAL